MVFGLFKTNWFKELTLGNASISQERIELSIKLFWDFSDSHHGWRVLTMFTLYSRISVNKCADKDFTTKLIEPELFCRIPNRLSIQENEKMWMITSDLRTNKPSLPSSARNVEDVTGKYIHWEAFAREIWPARGNAEILIFKCQYLDPEKTKLCNLRQRDIQSCKTTMKTVELTY